MKAMTIANIVAWFKVTGVFSLDKEALKLPVTSMEKLPEQ